MEASGGLMTVESARAKPVHTVLSGPAGGVVAASHFAGLIGADTIITMDIGGTSTDIRLIRNGRPETTRSAKIGQTPIRLPVIDINAIGAGGGSIAWIDDGGALRVGPISAEAVPGPACYGHGGTRPTISDANLVLGRLGGETRLGGRMRLDAAAAHAAIETHVARPLGLDVVAAAVGVLRVAHANIVRGIRVVSVERGHDPRGCTLVPFGGAGPMHGTPVARELNMSRVAVPPAPGILCALGQLLSDLRHDLIETHIFRYAAERGRKGRGDRAPADRRRPSPAGGGPRARGQAQGRGARRGPLRRPELRAADRLRGRDAGAWGRLADDFHAAHRARFGHADPEAPIEIVGFGATAVGKVEAPELPRLREGERTPPGEAQARQSAACSSRAAIPQIAAAGPRRRCWRARRCSPATRSRARPSSRRCRRPRCSIRAIAPRVDASGVLLVECSQ